MAQFQQARLLVTKTLKDGTTAKMEILPFPSSPPSYPTRPPPNIRSTRLVRREGPLSSSPTATSSATSLAPEVKEVELLDSVYPFPAALPDQGAGVRTCPARLGTLSELCITG